MVSSRCVRAVLGATLLIAVRVRAQDTTMHMPMGMSMSHMHMAPGPLGIPMTRMGSGTSWLPDASPMHAEHLMTGGWQLMLHYVAFATYDHQQSDRPIDGASQLNAIDWFMGMAMHDLGSGRVNVRAMVS